MEQNKIEESIKGKIINILKLIIILILYIFEVLVFNLVIGLFLKNSLSLLIAVILASISRMYSNFTVYNGGFTKKLNIILPLISSIIVFSFYVLGKNMAITNLLIQFVIAVATFIILYCFLKDFGDCLKDKQMVAQKSFTNLFASIKKSPDKLSKYENLLRIELIILVFLGFYLYIFTNLNKIVHFKIIYLVIVILILYFSIKYISKKL